MLSPCVSKADMSRHIGVILRRRPILDIVCETLIAEIRDAFSLQDTVHLNKLVT